MILLKGSVGLVLVLFVFLMVLIIWGCFLGIFLIFIRNSYYFVYLCFKLVLWYFLFDGRIKYFY